MLLFGFTERLGPRGCRRRIAQLQVEGGRRLAVRQILFWR
jgi:hypothetical protein